MNLQVTVTSHSHAHTQPPLFPLSLSFPLSDRAKAHTEEVILVILILYRTHVYLG